MGIPARRAAAAINASRTPAPPGTGLSQLTSNAADDTDPAWSAAGNKLAFTSDRAGNNEIYTMSANGNNQSRLTNSPGSDEFPAS